MTPFLTLCRCLALESGSPPPGVVPASNDVAGWMAVVQTADADMLAPALWLALGRKGMEHLVPAQIRGLLHRRYTMNALLNERIRDEALHVAGLCEQLGVSPVILKGGAYLFEAGTGAIGGRAMRDLDFLLPADAVPDVAEAMLAEGYRIKEAADDDWTYTHPGLQRPGAVVAVELHHRVGQQRALLHADMAWRDVRPLVAEPRLRVLSPTHRVWHNIFHSQVQDQGHPTGLIWLRQLVDLVQICDRHGPDIDWAALDQLMRAAGMGGVLRTRLYQAHRLLGLPWPLPTSAGLAARLRYRRAIWLLAAPRAMAATRLWAALTAPFKAQHIDLIYDCGTRNPFKLAAARLRHVGLISRRYRGNLLGRLWLKRSYDV